MLIYYLMLEIIHPSNESRANGLVFFKVTSIECDAVLTSSPPLQDIYTGSTLGELGCWIDTSVTRVTQTGVEHTRIPDVTSYLQIGRFETHPRQIKIEIDH
jgi:peroxin-6